MIGGEAPVGGERRRCDQYVKDRVFAAKGDGYGGFAAVGAPAALDPPGSKCVPRRFYLEAKEEGEGRSVNNTSRAG